MASFIIKIFLVQNSFLFLTAIYTNEVPVKLLEVESMSDRFPASESEYRISVTDGHVSVNIGGYFQNNCHFISLG